MADRLASGRIGILSTLPDFMNDFPAFLEALSETPEPARSLAIDEVADQLKRDGLNAASANMLAHGYHREARQRALLNHHDHGHQCGEGRLSKESTNQ